MSIGMESMWALTYKYVPRVSPDEVLAGIVELDKTVSKSTFEEISRKAESLERQSTQAEARIACEYWENMSFSPFVSLETRLRTDRLLHEESVKLNAYQTRLNKTKETLEEKVSRALESVSLTDGKTQSIVSAYLGLAK